MKDRYKTDDEVAAFGAINFGNTGLEIAIGQAPDTLSGQT